MPEKPEDSDYERQSQRKGEQPLKQQNAERLDQQQQQINMLAAQFEQEGQARQEMAEMLQAIFEIEFGLTAEDLEAAHQEWVQEREKRQEVVNQLHDEFYGEVGEPVDEIPDEETRRTRIEETAEQLDVSVDEVEERLELADQRKRQLQDQQEFDEEETVEVDPDELRAVQENIDDPADQIEEAKESDNDESADDEDSD